MVCVSSQNCAPKKVCLGDEPYFYNGLRLYRHKLLLRVAANQFTENQQPTCCVVRSLNVIHSLVMHCRTAQEGYNGTAGYEASDVSCLESDVRDVVTGGCTHPYAATIILLKKGLLLPFSPHQRFAGGRLAFADVEGPTPTPPSPSPNPGEFLSVKSCWKAYE